MLPTDLVDCLGPCGRAGLPAPMFYVRTAPGRVLRLCKDCRAELVRVGRDGEEPEGKVCGGCGELRDFGEWYRWPTRAAWLERGGLPVLLEPCRVCLIPALEKERAEKRREKRRGWAKARRARLAEEGKTRRRGRPAKIPPGEVLGVLSGHPEGMTVAEVWAEFQRFPKAESYGASIRTVGKMLARGVAEGAIARSLMDPQDPRRGWRYRVPKRRPEAATAGGAEAGEALTIPPPDPDDPKAARPGDVEEVRAELREAGPRGLDRFWLAGRIGFHPERVRVVLEAMAKAGTVEEAGPGPNGEPTYRLRAGAAGPTP